MNKFYVIFTNYVTFYAGRSTREIWNFQDKCHDLCDLLLLVIPRIFRRKTVDRNNPSHPEFENTPINFSNINQGSRKLGHGTWVLFCGVMLIRIRFIKTVKGSSQIGVNILFYTVISCLLHFKFICKIHQLS